MLLQLGNAISNKTSCTGVYGLHYILLSAYHKQIKENTHIFKMRKLMFQSRALVVRPDCFMSRSFHILPYIDNSNTPSLYSQC